jgi:hypothetical protein
MIAFANEPEDDGKPDAPGGKGDAYLSPTQENKMLATVTNPRRRFKLTKEAKQIAIDMTIRNMRHDNGRVSNGAVANLIRMEAMNQAEAHAARKSEDDHPQHVENQQINIYLPSNGREAHPDERLSNGSNGNGKH